MSIPLPKPLPRPVAETLLRAGECLCVLSDAREHVAAVSAAKDARIKVLEDVLAEVLEFQSAPTQPTIHDWARWRRALYSRAALEQGS